MQTVSTGRETIGRYQVIKPLAQGGMAEIFLARQEGPAGFGKTVVVKRVLAHLATDEGFIEMFQDEARLASQLSHPNIVQIFDFGQDEGTYYLAMEYLAGEDLSAIIRQATVRGRPIPPQIAALICSHSLEGLHYAHNLEGENGEPLGIVHRDISPSNIMITYQGSVKVLDFGIAKAAGKIVKTQVGTVKGKFMYMSPEQARGRPIDGRSDLFAMGAVLYEMLTGVRLFHRENQMATLLAVTEQPVPSPREHRPDLPGEIEEILMRALEKDPAGRFSSAQTMREALDEYLASRTYAPSHVQLRQYLLDLFGREHVAGQQRLPVTNPGAAAVVDTAVRDTGKRAEGSAKPALQPDADVEIDLGSDDDSDKTPIPSAASPVASTPISPPETPHGSPTPEAEETIDALATRLIDVSAVKEKAEAEAQKIKIGDEAVGDQATRLFSLAEVEEKAPAAQRKRLKLGDEAVADQTTRLASADQVKEKARIAEEARRKALQTRARPTAQDDSEDYDDFDDDLPRKKPLGLWLGVGGGVAAILVVLFVFVLPGGTPDDLHAPEPIGGVSRPVVDRGDAGRAGIPPATDPVAPDPIADPVAPDPGSDEGRETIAGGTENGGEGLAGRPEDPPGGEEVAGDSTASSEGGAAVAAATAEPPVEVRVEPEPEVASSGDQTTTGRRQGTSGTATGERTTTAGERRGSTATGGRTGTSPARDTAAATTKDPTRQTGRTTGTRQAAETTTAPPAPSGQGTLMVNCIPWCQIFVNDRDTGRTSPARDISLAAGRHRLKVVHPPTGMERFEDIEIRPGQETVAVVRF